MSCIDILHFVCNILRFSLSPKTDFNFTTRILYRTTIFTVLPKCALYSQYDCKIKAPWTIHVPYSTCMYQYGFSGIYTVLSYKNGLYGTVGTICGSKSRCLLFLDILFGIQVKIMLPKTKPSSYHLTSPILHSP